MESPPQSSPQRDKATPQEGGLQHAKPIARFQRGSRGAHRAKTKVRGGTHTMSITPTGTSRHVSTHEAMGIQKQGTGVRFVIAFRVKNPFRCTGGGKTSTTYSQPESLQIPCLSVQSLHRPERTHQHKSPTDQTYTDKRRLYTLGNERHPMISPNVLHRIIGGSTQGWMDVRSRVIRLHNIGKRRRHRHTPTPLHHGLTWV